MVDLSSQVGDDIISIQSSYAQLVDAYYERLIDDRLDYLDNEWYPAYVKNWMRIGRLQEIAKGDIVWSEDDEKFTEVTEETPSMETINTLQIWVEEALWTYQEKKEELINPLITDRDTLKYSINVAFNNLTKANAEITAHLNSLRKVKEQQDQLLEELKLKRIRDQINEALIDASAKAGKGLEKVREADAKLEEINK
ncbi:MAG: hypothetical protein RLO17_24170 [Cyclobacteriaceae bacterium]